MQSRKRRLADDDDDHEDAHATVEEKSVSIPSAATQDASSSKKMDEEKNLVQSEDKESDNFVPRSTLKQIAKRYQKESSDSSSSGSEEDDDDDAEGEEEHDNASSQQRKSSGDKDDDKFLSQQDDSDRNGNGFASSQERSKQRNGPVPTIFKSFFKANTSKKNEVFSETSTNQVDSGSPQNSQQLAAKKEPLFPVKVLKPRASETVASPKTEIQKTEKVVNEKEGLKSEPTVNSSESYAGAYMSAPPPEVASKAAHTTSSIFGSFADHLFSSPTSSSSNSTASKAKGAPKPTTSKNAKASRTAPLAGSQDEMRQETDSATPLVASTSKQSADATLPTSGVAMSTQRETESKESSEILTSESSQSHNASVSGSVPSELLEDLKKMSTLVDEDNDFDDDDIEASGSDSDEGENSSDEDDSERKRGEEKDNDGDGDDVKPSKHKAKKLMQPTIIPKPVDQDEPDDGNPLGTPNYDPIAHAGWKKGQKVPYAALASMFAKCESTTKRLKIISYVSDFLRSVIALSPDTLLPAVYLCVNEVAPSYEGKELGIGDQILLKALSEATGSTLTAVKAQYRETGDLGVVAEKARAKQRTLVVPQKLSVQGVFSKLREISDLKGNRSGERKKDFIKQLLVSSVGHEARFLCRALQGNLRIQLGLLSVLRALARAIILTPPEYPPVDPSDIRRFAEDDQIENDEDEEDEEDLKKKAVQAARPRTRLEILIDETHSKIEAAYNEGPSLDRLIDALLKVPLDQLHTKCFLTPGQPIKVMLGKPATGLSEVIAKFEGSPFTLEYKYDGERAQIHRLPDGTFKIYSRNLEDNTSKYPDIITKLPRALAETTQSFILDAEVVAWDAESKKILPFQTLSTRKRKDVGEETVTVQVVLFGFDLLYLNGKSYMKRTFMERREKMREAFVETEGVFMYSKNLDTSELEDIDTFFQQAVEDSCEGLMVKPLVKNARYVPDKRKWIKIKKDYLDGVGDTLDLVPLGAWYGKGKRTGTYGAFLLFSYDESEQAYQVISKIGTGFKDTDLESLSESLKGHVIDGPKSYYQYSPQKTLVPDVWFEPSQVWEVKCADLSVSPVYLAAAGLVHESKGIAMRFPRFLRLRPDKKPENATDATQVADMYMNQSVVKSSGAAAGGPPRR